MISWWNGIGADSSMNYENSILFRATVTIVIGRCNIPACRLPLGQSSVLILDVLVFVFTLISATNSDPRHQLRRINCVMNCFNWWVTTKASKVLSNNKSQHALRLYRTRREDSCYRESRGLHPDTIKSTLLTSSLHTPYSRCGGRGREERNTFFVFWDTSLVHKEQEAHRNISYLAKHNALIHARPTVHWGNAVEKEQNTNMSTYHGKCTQIQF